MESAAESQTMSKEPLLPTKSCSRSSSSSEGGGFRALPFIIVTDALEKVVSYGLPANMIVYLTTEYGMKNSDGAQLIFIWVAATNFMPVVGAFLADSYVGRYWMIAFGSLTHVLGTFLLWLTTTIPEARPQVQLPCAADTSTYLTCKQATVPQLSLLYASLTLISIGSGSMRSSSLAFCGDQIIPANNKHGTKHDPASLLESLVSWYFLSTTVAILIAVTAIVYIQEAAGWRVGFGVPLILMMLASLIFVSGSSLYVKQKTKPSLLAELAQVVAATCKNRGIKLPSQSTALVCYHSKSPGLEPSVTLRFLNRACIITNPEEVELNPDGVAANPWSLCTVEQVEDLKSLIRVIPIWFAGVVMSLPTNQQPFHLLQLNTMDRHITPTFQIPAASFSLVTMLTLLLWVPLYNRVIIPIASKLKGKPTRLSMKQRLGLGILLSSVSMAALAVVETIRRGRAIDEGLADDPTGMVDMSAMWFVLYYIPFGVTEGFNYIAQSEFYYSELPKSMASISTTLYFMGLSTGSLVASFVLSSFEIVTKGGGEESWIAENINKGHYDYYYWVIAGLIALDFVYYLGCAQAYGPCKIELCEGLDTGEPVDHKGN